MEKSKNIIHKTAKICLRRLPPDSTLQLDDLVQEGWVVYLGCEQDFDETRGTSFHTYLWSCLANRYQSIVRTELRYYARFGLDKGDVEASYAKQDTERQFIIHEFLMTVMRGYSREFTKMIMNGPDETLFAVVRTRMRKKRMARGLSPIGGNVRFDNRLLEIYYGLDLSKGGGMALAAYNVLRSR